MSESDRETEPSPESPEVHEILKTEHALDEALLHADMAALDTLLAPEATRTAPSGVMTTRAQWLEEMNSAIRTTGSGYSSIEREAQQVRLYGETAVVTGLVHIRGYRTGPTGQPNFNRYLRVYVRRKGGWQLVAHQATRVTSP